MKRQLKQDEKSQIYVRDEQWRQFGKARRIEILKLDEVEGGTSFRINKRIRIHQYFRLAERVVNQFRVLCSNLDASSLERTFVMGHRLLAFLSKALPKHPEYLSIPVAQQRNKLYRNLVWINDFIDEIAFKIDEEYLNRYIANEFDPDFDDSASVSSELVANWSLEDLDMEIKTNETWESFPSWSAETSSSYSDLPLCVDTDNSTSSSEIISCREDSKTIEEPDSCFEINRFDFYLDFSAQVSPLHAQASYEDFKASENELESSFVYDEYSASEDVRSSHFLRKISQEDVLFETDSEAADSWA